MYRCPSHNLNLPLSPSRLLPPLSGTSVSSPSHRSSHLPSAAGLAVLQVSTQSPGRAPDPRGAGTDLASLCKEGGGGTGGRGGGGRRGECLDLSWPQSNL